MRLSRHAAIGLSLALTIIGGPISAAPISNVRDQAVAQATSSPTPAANGTLTGTVYDSGTNKPLGGAVLTVSNAVNSYSASSAADGTFTISLPQGIYDIDSTKGGFQAARISSFAISAGATSNVPVYLTEANSNSLRTIGRVAVSRRNSLNTSSSAITTLDNSTIQAQDLPNLTTEAEELPGVTISRSTGATANTFFQVRGAEYETRTNIDGHPLSVGTFGAYNTNYAISSIFDSVEVLKGTGLNGPTAGESAFGTINLRTRDFSPKNYLDVKGGLDGFKGSFYDVFGNVNLFNGRLSLLGGKAMSGYNGPFDQYIANRVGTFGSTPAGLGYAQTFPGLIAYQADFSNRYNLTGELAKARFRFSPTTSISAEYLGLEGQYIPQGGSYGSFYGNETVQACYNPSSTGAYTVASPTMAGCGTQSLYNAPSSKNLIGQTVPVYAFFPNSYIQNNEPQLSAELRTALKSDTILLRPYTALVNRFISGDRENRYPGETGTGFYEVTSNANCQATFAGPSATAAYTGAKGPCYTANYGISGPAYIGASSPTSVVYGTTPVAPNCSMSNPCYTTATGYQNDGKVGFGAPFSQPEVDRLHGVTFQYLHPVADNLYNFSYDYNADDTYSETSDTTTPPAGCKSVIGSVANTAAAAGIGYQPTCLIPGTAQPFPTLPRTDLSIPPTIIRKNDFALTAQNQITPELQSAIGLYYSNYHSIAQTENPATLKAYAASVTSAAAPVDLIQNSNSVHHFDPHIGFTLRPDPSVVIRATGGSSETFPFASLISGVGSVTLPNSANNSEYVLALANSNLAPESTVSYDLGSDLRLPDTSIFSLDLFDNTIHNVFVNINSTIPAISGITAPGGFFQTETVNGPIARYYGAELSLNKSQPIGFGYTATATLERAYLDQLPNSFYTSRINAIDGKQLDGTVNFNVVPYAKGYAEIRYAGIRNSLISIGADYEGNNNETYGPAYTVFNSTVRFEIAPEVAFQLSVDNLTNVNTGTLLGRALFNQGAETVTYGPVKPGAPFTYGLTPKQLQQVDFRTARFSLQHRF